MFWVSDNGLGIEAEYFDRIFVLFQRLHTRDACPGSGIGLAIVNLIVERHGGRIGGESTRARDRPSSSPCRPPEAIVPSPDRCLRSGSYRYVPAGAATCPGDGRTTPVHFYTAMCPGHIPRRRIPSRPLPSRWRRLASSVMTMSSENGRGPSTHPRYQRGGRTGPQYYNGGRTHKRAASGMPLWIASPAGVRARAVPA